MNDNDTLADDLRKDSLALMKLLADEKHKSEALAAELAGTKDELYSVDKAAKQLGAELTEAKLQRDSWKRIAESGLGLPQTETACDSRCTFDTNNGDRCILPAGHAGAHSL